MEHIFSKDDISDMKEAVRLLMSVRNKIETDASMLEKMDDLIGPIQDLIKDQEKA